MLEGEAVETYITRFSDFQSTLLVETDASSALLVVVLSQKKDDGKLYPAKLAYHTMTERDCRYYMTKREGPYVVFLFKK